MQNNVFEVFALAHAGWTHPGPAVAATRAGGTGLLDLEFCDDEARATANFERLFEASRGEVGLYVAPEQRELAWRLIAAAGDRPLTLVLAGAPTELSDLAAALGRDGDRVLAEIRDTGDLDALGFTPDGLVAKGHESGGWVGSDTSYILAQKLVDATDLPLLVRGGGGVRAAAACRVAGAAGVVLDDQLLLLAESPLAQPLQAELARLNGSETRLFGELLGTPCRLYARAGSDALSEAERQSNQAEAGELGAGDWHAGLEARVGWDQGELLPLGQGVGIAATLRDRHKRVGKLVQAIQRDSAAAIASAAELGHLAPGAPLAESHGTRYPLVQGPMTRVSDSADFCQAVSENGALPFLALALMRGEQVRELLAETKDKLGELPWGVGLLGFVPQQLRDEQIAAIWEYQPPFALIAGGRPDQAAEFEQRGIPAYIHAPAPALLKMYLEQGARRFVFEGRECGGHIGPIASFPLWEQMIDVLLAEVEPGTEEEVHVLFAGGVNDARSSAMLAALTAPLAERGIKVGALMGSAYLFTEEIVDTGAVVPGFRDQALACERTMSLETGPGHATRCSDTQFAHDFYERRRELLREGRSGDEIRDELEELNLGRLRMASKGRTRDDSGTLIEVEPERQVSDGMYMIGQVATMRDAVVPLAELHENVTAGGQTLLGAWGAPAEAADEADPCDIAIIGVGMMVPGAEGGPAFWRNVLGRVNAITEVPAERWDWRLYYDEDPSARDKVYSKWGGFLSETVFDPLKYGIPPTSMKVIDPMQLLALESCSRALDDAGLGDGEFDRENTSVILGAGGGVGDLGMQYGVRAELNRFVENPDDGAWDRLPEWGQESFSGSLQNVAAGRTANRLDLGGLNFTVDAACGSSLAAVTLATQELQSGRSNVAIAGGVDTVNGPFGFLCFAKTQALSPKGEPRAFDKNADGIAISEGACAVVMKRLADAERDGDRIYSVIRAAAGSSDGKALGMTAPRPEGQMRALNRAYAKAGFSPGDIDLIEAHGTGTPVGDRAEAETITGTLKSHDVAPRSVALGSVKSILGHTKCAAGVTGLVKVAMSLYHRTLPAHAGVEEPIEPIAEDGSPVYLLKQPRPWLTRKGRPRRGAVSAFGFGGTNFHVVMEEYRDGFTAPEVPGSPHWPHELCVFRADDTDELATEIGRLVTALRQDTDVDLATLAYSFARAAEARRGQPVCLAFTASDLESLTASLETVQAHLAEGKPLPPTIKLATAVPEQAPRVGFLFPGQGSQYVNMGAEPALYLEELRAALERADEALAARLERPLSRLMWPESAFDDATEAAQAAQLTDTRHAQPAIGALEAGYLRLVERLGLRAEAAAGHSYGEYAALLAAGVIDEPTFLNLSAIRGAAMAEAAAACEPGGMAAVKADRETVESHIGAFEGAAVANHNAPEETVISGPKAAVDQAVEALKGAGVQATPLPVSGAFHTELVAAAQGPLSEAIAAADLAAPTLALYSNTLGGRYPEAVEDIRATLDRHMLSTVEFVREIEAMHADGVALFVELGPKSVAGRMAEATLAGRDVRCVSLDGQGGGLRGLLSGLADLLVAGVDLDVAALYEPRGLEALDLSRLAELITPSMPKTAWLVSGGCARPLDDPILRTGKEPPLNWERKQAAVERAREREQAAAHQPQPAPTAQPAATQPAPPAPGQAPQQPAAGVAPPAGADQALAAYHETMRQFLSLQERVMSQYLGGGAGAGAPQPGQMPSAQQPVPPAAPAQAEAAQPAAQPAPEPAAAPQPEPAAAPAAAEAVDYRAVLMATVAELTGYPEEMLATDADLEADLGIDSIKRVEIMGAFQKKVPAAVGEAMQADMEAFTRAKTMDAVLARMDELAPAPASAPAAAPASAAAPAADVDYRATLLATVAELTGYPEEMLATDADLEADLGIDSIKRVEVMGAFQKKVPAAVGEAMQADMEAFTRAKTIDAVLAKMEELAPAASAPAGPAAAPAADVDYRSTLLATVAELTGYPEEMLATDADLEADLGIDSIKRVEIMGAFQKKVPAAVGEAMQVDMEAFTRAKTIDAVIAKMDELAPAAASAPAAAPAAAAPAADVDYRAMLLATVAELTGYPEEMLATDADLEADLGIDSIKRVEIMGAFQKKVPAAVGEAMQADMEAFTRAKTVDAVLAKMDELAGGAPPVADPAAGAAPAPEHQAEPEPATAPGGAELPRFAVRPHPAPLDGGTVAPEGLVLLAGPAGAIRDALAERLAADGAEPVVIEATEAEGIAAGVDSARAAHGPVRGLIFLHGLEEAAETADLAAWRQAGASTVLALFHLVRALGDDVTNLRLIAATRLGGTLGRSGEGAAPAVAGGAIGLVKSLAQEYPDAVARLVDFDGQTDATIAEHLLAEYRTDDPLLECGYSGDSRYRALTVAEPLADTPFSPHLEPAADWVVLATGGARGITADILAELVRPGMTVALVGRSPEPPAEAPELAGLEDPAALKKALLEAAKAAGESPKPVELDKRYQRVLADREIRANLARLREAGATVEYHAADVRDEAGFGAVIDDLYARHGRIDAVLHGAGIIEDKLLADKTPDSFERVFGTKVDSARILVERLRPDGLKALAFFTSVAGRFGNAGQADYACANEAVARLAWQLSRDWSGTRVMAVNWGPWDAGMASDGVKRQFRERGIEPIPVAAGAAYFVRELSVGPRRDVELVVGHGPWADEQRAVEADGGGDELPLMRGGLRMGPGGALVLDHRFSLDTDPYLGDHRMDDKPVLPATGAAEWIAEVAAAGWPGWQVAEVRDLRVLAGVVIEDAGGVDVQLKAKASSHSGLGEQMVTVEIQQAGRKAPAYRGTVRLVERLDAPPAFTGEPAAGDAVDLSVAYGTYLFHGPQFQLLQTIDACSAEAVDATARPTAVPDWLPAGGGAWLLDPGLLDCGPQLATVWTRVHHDTTALPSAFGAIRRYGHEPLTGPLRLHFRLQPGATAATLRYDVDYVDADGRVRLQLRDVEGTATAALNRLTAT